MTDPKHTIMAGRAVLGIEFGSTRIKAVLIDEHNAPIAQGAHEWENRYEGITASTTSGTDYRTATLTFARTLRSSTAKR